MTARLGIWLACATLVAAPALAQDTDPIGEALREAVLPPSQPAAPPAADSEEAEDSAPPVEPPVTTPQPVPRAPAPYRPSRSESYTYEGYDARLRSSFASAQGLLGTLDGAWTLSDASDRKLFAFQLADRGRADTQVEGVWRDLRRTPTPTSSGLVGTITRIGSELTLTFAASRGGFTTVTLSQSIDGSWAGRLREPDGESAVAMRRE